MAFKLKNIFSQLKKGQKERGMFSEKGKAERKEMSKTGESKFQYDVRKSRERNKQAKTDKPVTPTPEQLEGIDPKSEIKGTFSTAETYTVDTGDLRDTSKPQNFGIVPGMSFGEAFGQAGKTAKKGDIFFWQDQPFLYDFKNEETVVPDPYIGQKYAIDPFAGEEYDPTYKRKEKLNKNKKGFDFNNKRGFNF